MNMIWLLSSALIISSYWRELEASSCGGGSRPPGMGIAWAIIQRRQTFWATTQLPFQNCRTIRGLRTSSPGRSLN